MMHHHQLFFSLLLVTSCSADSSDECCKAKTVGGVSYTLSRVINENDANFEKVADCINKCVYKNTKSGKEFCFKSGELMVECNRMSHETMKSNSRMVAKNAKMSMQNLTAQFSKLDNFTTVQDKLEWAQMYMTNMPVMYNSSMDMFDAMMDKQRMEGPMIKDAKDFVKNVERDLKAAAGSLASVEEVLNKYLKEMTNTLEKNDTVVEYQMYALEAAKAMIKFIGPKSEGGEGGGELYFNALVANTEDTALTIDIFSRTRGWGSWFGWIATSTVAGAVSGCVGAAVATFFVAGVGCLPGAVAGAAAGAAGGVVFATVNEVKKSSSGCFSSDSMIETVLGLKMISELRIGDQVGTSRHEISLFTEFLGWLDRSSEASTSMLQIRTLTGPAITLTGSHLIFSNSTPRFARELRTGDSLMHWDGSGLQDAEIVDIRSVTTSGFWAPLTTEGTLLVDGFLASCYASFPHQVSDLAFSPVKMLPRLLLDDEDSQHEDGVRPYVRMVKAAGQLAGLRQEKPATDKLGAGDLSPFPILAGLSLNTEL